MSDEDENEKVAMTSEQYDELCKGQSPSESYQDGHEGGYEDHQAQVVQALRMMAIDHSTLERKLVEAGLAPSPGAWCEAIAGMIEDGSLLEAAFPDDEDAPKDVKDLLPGKDLN